MGGSLCISGFRSLRSLDLTIDGSSEPSCVVTVSSFELVNLDSGYWTWMGPCLCEYSLLCVDDWWL